MALDVHFPGGIDAPGLYWWMELVFWVLVFWFAWRNQAWLLTAFAIGGSLHLVNPSWMFGLAKSMPLLGLVLFMEILVRRRRRVGQRLVGS